MHIDFTPTIRRPGTPERESWIFHDRWGAPDEASMRLIANPYGFAKWFMERPAVDAPFAALHMARILEYERMQFARADTEPVPAQEPPAAKSTTTIAVQLLKRWRNVQYEPRIGRRPPSIVIAKLVADAPANHTNGLVEEMVIQAHRLRKIFQEAHDERALINVSNPVCAQDVLTDQWPRSLAEQETFLNDLVALVAMLQTLQAGCDLAVMKTIMKELFGEDPTTRVFSNYNQSIGSTVKGGSRHMPKSGGLVVPSRPTNGVDAGAAAIAGTVGTPKHKFYGAEGPSGPER